MQAQSGRAPHPIVNRRILGLGLAVVLVSIAAIAVAMLEVDLPFASESQTVSMDSTRREVKPAQSSEQMSLIEQNLTLPSALLPERMLNVERMQLLEQNTWEYGGLPTAKTAWDYGDVETDMQSSSGIAVPQDRPAIGGANLGDHRATTLEKDGVLYLVDEHDLLDAGGAQDPGLREDDRDYDGHRRGFTEY